MIGWLEIGQLSVAAAMLGLAAVSRLRPYRSLFWGAGALMIISALFPRPGNLLGQSLFSGPAGTPRIPLEIFGVAWWILGAWLVKSLLDLVLRRTVFPDDDRPHARRLFADLASVLVYVVAIAGIMDTVLKQPISAVLATSGVLAIVLGLALQTTLADVFSGLAINIERPFVPGDWISAADGAEGEVMEINWRATRIKTAANAILIIPNSIMAKALVTNHSRLRGAAVVTVRIAIDHGVAAAQVIEALEAAARGSSGIALGAIPQAYACEFAGALITYELAFPVAEFLQAAAVRSEVVRRVADTFRRLNLPIGAPAMDVRVLSSNPLPANGSRASTPVS